MEGTTAEHGISALEAQSLGTCPWCPVLLTVKVILMHENFIIIANQCSIEVTYLGMNDRMHILLHRRYSTLFLGK